MAESTTMCDSTFSSEVLAWNSKFNGVHIYMSPSDSYTFRIPERRGSKPSDPETLFRSLGSRSAHIQHLWAHQADILRSWHSHHLDSPDLALELPTGTGKTLIGLLIGDFVRQTREERVAYLCPNRQLAHQVGKLARDYSIDARVLVGSQASYDSDDFHAFEDSSAVAVTTYSAIFNTNPRIDSANLMILDDAHASEDFIASLWNVEVNRDDEPALFFALLDFFREAIPSSQMWNFRDDSTPRARAECGKIPSPFVQGRVPEFREFLDSALAKSNLRYSWWMIRDHLDACHIYVTWPSISIRPITPPTFSHSPFASARQRIYMSATLGEGGELERITGVKQIERLPAPEGWDREGTGRRFILFPERSLPPETARGIPIALAAEPRRTLILAPNRHIVQSVTDELRNLSPSPALFSAGDIENSLEPFLSQHHAALVLQNRYDGLDLPGEACHLEWICGLPGATNAQEAFLLNRLGIHSLLRDRIRTRLTQALGRCTRSATDHAVVIMSGPRVLDFCIKSENRSGFHPELQAEIEYGLGASQVQWPKQLLDDAVAFLEKKPGWEEVDQWIRNERESCVQQEDSVAQVLIANVVDEIGYANAIWVGDFQVALSRARACADRLGGGTLADYRAWWYYLAGSAASLSATREKAVHLSDVAREMFGRARAASPRSTWFREASRLVGIEVAEQPVDDPMVLNASEAIERRLQETGVAGAGFENEAQAMLDQLDDVVSTQFEQGLEQLGYWLGLEATRPKGKGVPDGVWSFTDGTVVAFEAKSNEQPEGPISLTTATQAQGHMNWVKDNMQASDSVSVSTVIISNRGKVAREALPNAQGLFVVSLDFVRQLGQRVVSAVRALRAEASETSNDDFRRVVAERLKLEQLDPGSILTELTGHPLRDFPV